MAAGSRALILAVAAAVASSALACVADVPLAAAATPLGCAALAERLAIDPAAVSGEVAVDGVAVRVDVDVTPQQLAVCGPPGPTVLCLTEAAEERQVGERLVVTGKVVETTSDFVRLESCVHGGR